jgi:hypothetical protein
VTTSTAAVVTVVVLTATGGLPVLALVGLRWVALFLAPLAGAVMAAVAAMLMVAVGGPVLAWFVGLGVTGAVVTISVWAARPSSRPSGHAETVAPGLHRLTGWAAALGVVGAAAWALQALRTPSVGFDARTIWMLHARWYFQGHDIALAALRNTALPFAHAGYPPLIGGTVAVAWKITGNHSYRFGVVVVALLNVGAVMAAGWALVDIGRRAGERLAEARRPPDYVGPQRVVAAPFVVGALAAGLFVLVAFGVAGPFATNGYADMLWAATAVGAVGYGLVLPGRRHDLGAAVVLLAVAGLTKDEGYVTAMVIVALISLRAAASGWNAPERRWWPPMVAGVGGEAGLALWPVLTRILHAAPNAAAPGRRDGTDGSRLHDSVSSMAPHLHVLVLAVALAVVGTLLLRRTRAVMGLGSELWPWLALLAGLAAVLVAYVTGPGNIELWLITSTHRTTIYGALLGWWLVALWAVIGSGLRFSATESSPGRPSRSA